MIFSFFIKGRISEKPVFPSIVRSSSLFIPGAAVSFGELSYFPSAGNDLLNVSLVEPYAGVIDIIIQIILGIAHVQKILQSHRRSSVFVSGTGYERRFAASCDDVGLPDVRAEDSPT
jgi:hypothetical protein